ncbi:MAG: hypothetical protein CSA62_09305 [Planctomycetota bacterium]|nr:MAG: hypothetical protein CSA62_09305 [Planctomycetota bacterium]
MIEFLQPDRLWFLLGLPLLWLLHWRRGKRILSGRLEIWERALARVPRQRRSWMDLRLFVSLLIATALLLAAAEPQARERPGVRVQHVVVDLSPSMQTRDVAGGTRLQAALAALAELQASLPEHVPLRIWGLRAQGLFAGALQPDREVARYELVERFAEFAGEEEALWFFGDGAGPSPWPEHGPKWLAMRSFGQASPNNSILSVQVEDPWPGPSLSLRIKLEVEGEGCRLLCRGPEQRLLASSELAPGSYERSLVLPRLSELELALEPGDAYSLDDRYLLKPKPALAPLVLQRLREDARSKALGRFLLDALQGRRAESHSVYLSATGPRLLVQSGGTAVGRAADHERRLLFGVQLPGMGPLRKIEGPCEWRRSDPLLEGLELTTLSCKQRRVAARSAFAPGARVLASYGPDPYLVFDPQGRTLWIGSCLEDGNLAVQAALPVLLLRALGEFREGGEGGEGTQTPWLPDPAERLVAARAAPKGPSGFNYYLPARSFWPELLLFAALLLLLRPWLR